MSTNLTSRMRVTGPQVAFLIIGAATLMGVGFHEGRMMERGMAEERTQRMMYETKVLIGPVEHPECQTEITFGVWDELNTIGLWRYMAACVHAKEGRP